MEGRTVGNDERPVSRMRCGYRWLSLVVLAAVACGLALSACGSSGGTTGAAGTGSTAGATSGGDGAEPSAEFVGPGKNGKLARQGKESSAAEREAASKVLEENLQARGAGDWAGQCASLTASIKKGVEASGSKGKAGEDCAASLEALAKGAPKEILENPMIEPVAALRINGKQALAFFHGAKGVDYVMPMEKEGAEWKVNSLTTQEIP